MFRIFEKALFKNMAFLQSVFPIIAAFNISMYCVIIGLTIMVSTYSYVSEEYPHTAVYINRNATKLGNKDYFYFDVRTFGSDFSEEVQCKTVYETSNQPFRNYISQRFDCDGEWCNDGWHCTVPMECYEVEHIIDKNGPEFTNQFCNKNVFGNLVMAYGRWNRQLGNLQNKNYKYSLNEKREIYNEERLNMARAIIERCNPGCVNSYEEEPEIKSSSRVDVIVIVVALLTIDFAIKCAFVYNERHRLFYLEESVSLLSSE